MIMSSADFNISNKSDPRTKCRLPKDRKFYLDLFCATFAEFIGTALYVFAGSTSLSNFTGNEHPHLPTVALTFGFSFAGLSAAMQHVR